MNRGIVAGYKKDKGAEASETGLSMPKVSNTKEMAVALYREADFKIRKACVLF